MSRWKDSIASYFNVAQDNVDNTHDSVFVASSTLTLTLFQVDSNGDIKVFPYGRQGSPITKGRKPIVYTGTKMMKRLLKKYKTYDVFIANIYIPRIMLANSILHLKQLIERILQRDIYNTQ